MSSPLRKPDYDVCVVVEFDSRAGKKKAKWFRVGSAWRNESGTISFGLVTMPGVKLRLMPNDKDDAIAQPVQEQETEDDRSTEPF